MLTLTVAEIKDLAECAGLVLKEGCEPDADELETEISIVDCPGTIEPGRMLEWECNDESHAQTS